MRRCSLPFGAAWACWRRGPGTLGAGDWSSWLRDVVAVRIPSTCPPPPASSWRTAFVFVPDPAHPHRPSRPLLPSGGAAAAASAPASCTTCSAAPRWPAPCATRAARRPLRGASTCWCTCRRRTACACAASACRCGARPLAAPPVPACGLRLPSYWLLAATTCITHLPHCPAAKKKTCTLAHSGPAPDTRPCPCAAPCVRRRGACSLWSCRPSPACRRCRRTARPPTRTAASAATPSMMTMRCGSTCTRWGWVGCGAEAGGWELAGVQLPGVRLCSGPANF